MNGRLALAVMVQLLAMAAVLFTPLQVLRGGQQLWLETDKMDPTSLFRGEYVILGYQLAQGILNPAQRRQAGYGTPVYVTVTTDRPARFVAVDFEPPQLSQGQACLVGRHRGSGGSVDFPQIAQFFVPQGEGPVLESARGADLLARVKVDADCHALLLGLEPR